ncbi:SMP-30/gluconolactonase/LRE family protein [Paenibacillus soyae]|uniref:SMP-30/gluconolactonase/LRE family protein n=1 Tax=Paenibacillus soyae TaxID=2969249 RepID=A0A9X2MU28_9BACL|nr:SMP-30/gluconolactonase/LRE family protein [Paenibacillus soyae]MCR2806505.1 SMP-30/gluconolactonase/LRE family protein [Paenibacillus soyae]
MIRTEQASLILDSKSELGEGPHWDSVSGTLYFVDIIGQMAHAYDPRGGKHDVHRFGLMPSSVIPMADGRWVLTMQDGIYSYSPGDGALEVLAMVEEDLPGNRFNDAKCDPMGRLWAGTMDMSFRAFTGSLYRMEPDGGVRRMLGDVGCSNGLSWDESKSSMYYIDTMKREVYGFHYETETGEISGRRKLLDWPEDAGSPDGMTIDAEGMLWIAHFGGGRVSRWNPANGELLGEIRVAAPNVTSCVFGGESLDELYITTARTGLTPSQLEAYPHAGGVFAAKLGVTGTPSRCFGGRDVR